MPRVAYFFLVIAHLAVVGSELNSCQPVSKHFYKKYSTKTPYQYIVDELDEKENVQPNSEDCQDVQVWSIVRHGTRYPSKEAIRFITKDVVEIREKILNSSNSLMCKEDLDNLLSWKPEQLNLDQSKDLHVEGEDELIYMGERMVSRFPNLLSEYHPQHFLFRATGTQRAELSGRSFAVGLFSRMIAHKVKFEDPIQPHDPLLRFYKLCKKWLKEVKKNNSSRIEFDLFSESSHVQEIRNNLTALLGLEETLTISDLDKIYVSCNFDQAWKPRKLSPWCTLFSDKALEIMEYREDLEYYWIDGPGNEISSSPACVLLKDVINNFQNSSLGVPEERGIFYFTHSGTLLKFLAFLGTHQDTQHLTSSNFNNLKNRKWRTSRIGAFASNISLVLRQCNGGFSVCVYVNEKIERIPGCSETCCSLEKFIKLFKTRLDKCDLDKICENKKGGEDDNISAPDDRF